MITQTSKSRKIVAPSSKSPVIPVAEQCAIDATPERVRERAFVIFQARVGAGLAGDALSDWLRAERDLKGVAPPVAPAQPTLLNEPRPETVEVRSRPLAETLLGTSA